MKVLVTGKGEEAKLGFEFIAGDPKRAKSRDEDEDDDDAEKPEKALIEATARKSLPGPREKKPRPTGTVPSVPKPKDD